MSSPWFQERNVEIGLAHLLTDGVRFRGGMDDFVAVEFIVAELDGSQPTKFHGEVKRCDVQKSLTAFSEHVTNFQVIGGPLRAVEDDGKA